MNHRLCNQESYNCIEIKLEKICYYTINLGAKLENENCDLEKDNCGAGLKCRDIKDGCGNNVGRCIKSGTWWMLLSYLHLAI